jgi:cytochrome c-type biogenesis protein CcmH
MKAPQRLAPLALGVLLLAAPLSGQGATADSALQARTRAVSSLLRCPVCQGESIQDSPSELSAQMRDLVRDQLRAGRSEEEVKQYFVDRYGEWILLQPKVRGANLLLYLAPILALIGGLILIWSAVSRWTRPQQVPGKDLTSSGTVANSE